MPIRYILPRPPSRLEGHFFWIDNCIIDRYGDRLGPYGLTIYMALARHADSDAESFPSYETLARETGMSRRKAQAAVKLLHDLHLVQVTQHRTQRDRDAAGHRTNTFLLFDPLDPGTISDG